MNDDQFRRLINFVDDTVIPDSNPVEFLRAGKLEGKGGKGFVARSSMRARARAAVFFGREARSFSTEGLKTTLYNATGPQSSTHFLQGDSALLPALCHDGQVVKVFHHSAILGEGHDNSFLFSTIVYQVLRLNVFHHASGPRILIIAD